MTDRDIDAVVLELFHPADERAWKVAVDADQTPQQMIDELVRQRELPEIPGGYQLAIRGGEILEPNTNLREAEVQSGAQLRILPATDAGSRG